MNDDLTLLREYARRNSEESFAALVSRHVNLVYSVALRQVRNAHLAEEITQGVFIVLARKADSLGDNIILPGWLCRTARYASANALTIQRRRQQREQEAHMENILNESANEQLSNETWNQIAPLLDGAMEKLGQKDHDALVLRFFENKTFAEVGAALGASEDAAKMRVNRALEKLRKFFTKRGVSSTTAIIAGTISSNSVQAAPVALAKSVTAVALAKGATASISTLTLIKGALKIMAWTKAQTAVVVSVVVLVAGTTPFAVHHYRTHSLDFSSTTDTVSIELPKDSWTNAGFASPQAALRTRGWAILSGDRDAFRESVYITGDARKFAEDALVQMVKASADPNKSQDIQNMADNKWEVEEAILMPLMAANRHNNFTGYKILSQQSPSADEMILQVETDTVSAPPNIETLKFQNFDGNWKLVIDKETIQQMMKH
jgi:RNA polymerase sigma factor (sigma-70 family)